MEGAVAPEPMPEPVETEATERTVFVSSLPGHGFHQVDGAATAEMVAMAGWVVSEVQVVRVERRRLPGW